MLYSYLVDRNLNVTIIPGVGGNKASVTSFTIKKLIKKDAGY